jgi:hypothetical protein
MSWRVIGLLLFGMIAGVVGITSAVVVQAMVDEVNHERSSEDRVSPFGWYPGKLATVVALYREAVPTGRRHIQLAGLLAIGVLGFVLAVVCLFLPS